MNRLPNGSMALLSIWRLTTMPGTDGLEGWLYDNTRKTAPPLLRLLQYCLRNTARNQFTVELAMILLLLLLLHILLPSPRPCPRLPCHPPPRPPSPPHQELFPNEPFLCATFGRSCADAIRAFASYTNCNDSLRVIFD